MEELEGGIRRVTLPLPTRPGHVHAYLLPDDEGWTLVDTGIGLPDARERWRDELALAGGKVARILVTHFHPDHVGAAADLHELTGAPVLQGALDYAQCELVWGNPAWPERLVDWFRLHGAPHDVTAELVGQSSVYRPFIRYQHEIQEHHRRRLEETLAALSDRPLTGYQLSFPLFGDDLKPASRRFAVAESLSHAERLVHSGAVRREEDGGTLTYTAA